MDVSEEEVLIDNEGASSEPDGGPGDDSTESSGTQDDETDVEDNDQEGLAEDDEEEQEDDVCFTSIHYLDVNRMAFLEAFFFPCPNTSAQADEGEVVTRKTPLEDKAKVFWCGF